MSDPRRNRFKAYAGVLVSVLLAALAGWVLWRTFQRIRFADVLAQMAAVPASTLALAGLCAAGAFTVLALYEVAVVRYVKQEVGRAKPILTAYIAFPLGHAVGQAMLSGGALRYEGEHVNDAASGLGVFFWRGGDSFSGMGAGGSGMARGVLTYANGQRYEGEMLNGQRNGQGVVWGADGVVIQAGRWSRDQLEGPVKLP